MKLTRQDLDAISRRTLDHYDEHANEFWEGTRDHDVTQNIEALFSSNPRGRNEEGWSEGRYGAYHELTTWRAYVTAAGFVELVHYYRPAGLPREHQPWLATVWRKLPRAG